MKIVLTYVVFVAMMLVMVFLAMRQQVDLDAPDYYDQELAYQKRIDASKNNAAEGVKWKIEPQNNQVVISYPDSLQASSVNGSILFFRASDANLDVKESIKLDDNGQQFIPLTEFIKGAYLVKIDWKVGEKNYFEQSYLFLN